MRSLRRSPRDNHWENVSIHPRFVVKMSRYSRGGQVIGGHKPRTNPKSIPAEKFCRRGVAPPERQPPISRERMASSLGAKGEWQQTGPWFFRLPTPRQWAAEEAPISGLPQTAPQGQYVGCRSVALLFGATRHAPPLDRCNRSRRPRKN